MASKELLLPDGADKAPASLAAVARNFLVLGCTAFGGPPVHFGMFQKRLIEEQGWLSSERYAELMAIANCLPGPSSTQVAFAIGITQQGVRGGLAAGLAFLLPGFFVMTALGFGAHRLREEVDDPKSVANAVASACSAVGVALVFAAVTGLVKKSAQGARLGAICFGSAACCALASPSPPWLNPALIFLGGAATALLPAPAGEQRREPLEVEGKTGLSTGPAVAIFVLYLGMAVFTLYAASVDKGWLIAFLTAGMFVWGGGPVVLPMLMTVLTPKYVSQTIFLTGIALAEMMPGPVFNMAAFLGVQLALATGFPWAAGTLLAWAGLVGPGVVLIFGAVPLWSRLRAFKAYHRALPGLNAAAVGLLVATIFTVYGALEQRSPWPAGSRAVALCAYAAIELAQAGAPTVVVLAGLAGWAWSGSAAAAASG